MPNVDGDGNKNVTLTRGLLWAKTITLHVRLQTFWYILFVIICKTTGVEWPHFRFSRERECILDGKFVFLFPSGDFDAAVHSNWDPGQFATIFYANKMEYSERVAKTGSYIVKESFGCCRPRRCLSSQFKRMRGWYSFKLSGHDVLVTGITAEGAVWWRTLRYLTYAFNDYGFRERIRVFSGNYHIVLITIVFFWADGFLNKKIWINNECP